MRKGDDGEEKKKKEKKIKTFLVATNVVASQPPNGDRLQPRPLVPKERFPYPKIILARSFNLNFLLSG